MKMSKQKKFNIVIHSIHDFLNLFEKAWMVEFDVSDFGASIAALFELPIHIYESQAKEFFLRFINTLLRNASISFIQRKRTEESDTMNVELALIGLWNNEQLAIPLWILDNTLIGFEVIQQNKYELLDSFQLEWISYDPLNRNQHMISKEVVTFSDLSNSLFNRNTIYFEINQSKISIANHQYSSELAFFDRIVNTVIPELDENNTGTEIEDY